MTLARQVRIGVAAALVLALVLISLIGGPRWFLWLLGGGGFVAIALTKELCPSCGAGPNDLRQPPAPPTDKPAP